MIRLTPAACAGQHWDAIVVGTGMGGAAFGWALAQAGRRVLFCEQGEALHLPVDTTALQGGYAEQLLDQLQPDAAQRAQAGRWRETVDDISAATASARGAPPAFIPFIGTGTGGSTALYGMVLERFQPHDFAADERPSPSTALAHRWPFSYAALQPYYALAERYFGLRGDADPLRGDPPALNPAAALSPAGNELHAHFTARGLHPYSPPLACQLRPGCTGCQGYLCAQDCKRDSATTFLLPALHAHGAALLSRTRALRLESDAHTVTALEVETDGQRYRLHADTYALAAGALATPRLLLASHNTHWPQGLGNQAGLVGRGLMRHLIDLYAVATRHAPAPGRNLKELAFNDWYTPDSALGSVQSFGPLPPPAVLAADLLEDLAAHRATRWLAHTQALHTPFKQLIGLGSRRLRQATVLATTAEDAAHADNRVSLGEDGRLQIAYRVHAAERARVAQFRARMGEVLAPYRYTLLKQTDSNKRLAHVCGTCRLGTDPDSGVLDAQHRPYGLDNLRIVDGAALPVSGGTNPGLTICATALRAADLLLGGKLCQTEGERGD